MPTWNSGNCCGYALENHIDDIGFFRALIEKLECDYAIDRKRIDFTGISNGAMMSYRVACETIGPGRGHCCRSKAHSMSTATRPRPFRC